MIISSDLHPSIIDVRSSTEFLEGKKLGSINIPILNIRGYDAIAIAYCYLLVKWCKKQPCWQFSKKLGIECMNGGFWKDYKSNVVSA